VAEKKLVPSLGRIAFADGHKVNESYKQPSAGRENHSYMHPQVTPLNFETAWHSADKALAESERPPDQGSRSKTVFPVATDKTRGTPKPPAYAKATRAQSHSPKGQGGIVAGPAKPTIF